MRTPRPMRVLALGATWMLFGGALAAAEEPKPPSGSATELPEFETPKPSLAE